MHTAFRDPDTLAITVVRHARRGETSVLIEHEEDGLRVVIWDDWSPVPDGQVSDWVSVVVGVWMRTGPLAAAAASLGAVPRRRGRSSR